MIRQTMIKKALLIALSTVTLTHSGLTDGAVSLAGRRDQSLGNSSDGAIAVARGLSNNLGSRQAAVVSCPVTTSTPSRDARSATSAGKSERFFTAPNT